MDYLLVKPGDRQLRRPLFSNDEGGKHEVSGDRVLENKLLMECKLMWANKLAEYMLLCNSLNLPIRLSRDIPTEKKAFIFTSILFILYVNRTQGGKC